MVEDEILIRMDVGDQLREAGWTVYELGTADDAIEFLQSPIHIDLLLTDVQMPGRLDGLALAAFVRRERPTVKVAVMSGNYLPTQQDQHLFDCFFSKPALMVAPELQAVMRGTVSAADRSPPNGSPEPTEPNHPRG
ncbi:response regulator [Mesorhizobium sp. LNJC394B00]|uniref:response regulator n=1 Tax=Mesorhizobium sp. LNJC394B00 TaxID=1287274 RepID=UPI001FD8CAAB|nr:response regulator [Mesorhizobium sp. LNJC394B00]